MCQNKKNKTRFARVHTAGDAQTTRFAKAELKHQTKSCITVWPFSDLRKPSRNKTHHLQIEMFFNDRCRGQAETPKTVQM